MSQHPRAQLVGTPARTAAFALAGGAAIAVAWVLLPRVSLAMAKRQAMETLSALDARSQAAMGRRLDPAILRIDPAPAAGQYLWHEDGQWAFGLPADGYKPSTDPNRPGVFEGRHLTVHLGGAFTQTPDFRAGHGPSNDGVWQHFQRMDPYELLCEAFAATPQAVQGAQSHAELQKALYLLLLRSFAQPIGCDKQWLKIEAAGRKGFLAGDPSSAMVHVSIYLQETRQFAGVGLAPKAGASMDDIWRCLGGLSIRRQPAVQPAAMVGFRPAEPLTPSP